MTLEFISSRSPTPHPVEEHDRPPRLAARVVTALIVESHSSPSCLV
jgi:hypothetical protein